MSFGAERFIASNLPAPEQLEQLASIGVDSGKERQKLQQHKKDGYYYMLDVLESDIELGDEADGLSGMRHTVGMNLGERKDDGEMISTLKYYDSFHLPVKLRAPQRPASSIVRYEFQWTDKKVLLARRIGKMMSVDSFGVLVENLYSGRPDYGDDEAEVIGAEAGFQQMTDEETAALIDEAASYYAKVGLLSQ